MPPKSRLADRRPSHTRSAGRHRAHNRSATPKHPQAPVSLPVSIVTSASRIRLPFLVQRLSSFRLGCVARRLGPLFLFAVPCPVFRRLTGAAISTCSIRPPAHLACPKKQSWSCFRTVLGGGVGESSVWSAHHTALASAASSAALLVSGLLPKRAAVRLLFLPLLIVRLAVSVAF
ncbi:hypothetical protein BU16DRAFT_34186 [Lophium mytilinum]|uniref:Uncharacterized protein n=1 Tax=Lophium mytilinum TaxID=390894 RepID=A0A6A6REQ2_9PEZI|nr:hypothetical protein BU16DRAFT_34186 [Lophium mytilinum]